MAAATVAGAAATTITVKTLFPTLLLVALWLITEHVAMVKFPSLLALLVMTGNETIKHKYNAKRYFWSCLYALSEVVLLAQRSALLHSPFYNILIDSSTDISAEDHLLIYARYKDADTFDAVPDATWCPCLGSLALHNSQVAFAGIVGREVALVCHHCPLPFAILGDVWVVLETAAAGSVAVTSRSTLARVLGPRVEK